MYNEQTMCPTTPKPPRKDLLAEVAAAIEPHGLEVKILRRELEVGGRYADAELLVKHRTGHFKLLAETKAPLTTANIGPVIAQITAFPRPGVIVADYVNPLLAERLRQQGVFFLDAAGNAFLDDQGLFVWVTGRRNREAHAKLQANVRAFKKTGLKLVFCLLCQPDLIETDYRNLARTAGIALGNVGWIFRDLIEGGFVRQRGGRRVLAEPKRLLDQWTEAYAERLLPQLTLGRFVGRRMAEPAWREIDVAKYHALWGGEPAGALLTKFLKPATFTLYVTDKTPAPLVAAERLVKEETGPLEIRRRFWNIEQGRPGVVPPVLAYADLMAIGDGRTIETARRVYDEHIHGYFEAYLARTAR